VLISGNVRFSDHPITRDHRITRFPISFHQRKSAANLSSSASSVPLRFKGFGFS
jgi:hypothetical protein